MLKKIGRNDPCWCGSGKKYKDCHLALDEKINSYKLKGWKIPPKKIIKRPDQSMEFVKAVLSILQFWIMWPKTFMQA